MLNENQATFYPQNAFKTVGMFSKSTTRSIMKWGSPRVLLIASLLLLTGMALGARNKRPQRLVDNASARRASQQFPCLPKDVTADAVVSYGPKGTQKVTVAKKLAELKARCRNGKLVDAKGREIRFFRMSCWGNPPPDYLEIQQRESKELAELKRRYTVIVFTCNPMIQ